MYIKNLASLLAQFSSMYLPMLTVIVDDGIESTTSDLGMYENAVSALSLSLLALHPLKGPHSIEINLILSNRQHGKLIKHSDRTNQSALFQHRLAMIKFVYCIGFRSQTQYFLVESQRYFDAF